MQAIAVRMKPITDQGLQLDAEVHVIAGVDGVVSVVIEAWSGRKNTEYAKAVALCLQRLGMLGATLNEVSVASANPDIEAGVDRHLVLEGFELPLPLKGLADVEVLRMEIGRKARAEGRDDGGKGGGNATKKLEILCSAPSTGWPRGSSVASFIRYGSDEQPPSTDQRSAPIEVGPQPRIFATLNWGFEPAVWGTIGFSAAKTRDALARELKNGGFVLSIGTRGRETPPHQRGRLLALLKLGPQAVHTEALVDPLRWRVHLEENGGRPKWPYGLPVVAADTFADPALSADILPRFDVENLHIVLATNWRELAPDEVARVIAMRRVPVHEIWSSPQSAFAARLRVRPGPPPGTRGSRLLRADSGPAATYCYRLDGALAAGLPELCSPTGHGCQVYKVGYSNDPLRRGRELNAFLPHAPSLEWKLILEQWHDDEINAWAMEQQVFAALSGSGAHRFKGEMVTATPEILQAAWTRGRAEAVRPQQEVWVEA